VQRFLNYINPFSDQELQRIQYTDKDNKSLAFLLIYQKKASRNLEAYKRFYKTF